MVKGSYFIFKKEPLFKFDKDKIKVKKGSKVKKKSKGVLNDWEDWFKKQSLKFELLDQEKFESEIAINTKHDLPKDPPPWVLIITEEKVWYHKQLTDGSVPHPVPTDLKIVSFGPIEGRQGETIDPFTIKFNRTISDISKIKSISLIYSGGMENSLGLDGIEFTSTSNDEIKFKTKLDRITKGEYYVRVVEEDSRDPLFSKTKFKVKPSTTPPGDDDGGPLKIEKIDPVEGRQGETIGRFYIYFNKDVKGEYKFSNVELTHIDDDSKKLKIEKLRTLKTRKDMICYTDLKMPESQKEGKYGLSMGVSKSGTPPIGMKNLNSLEILFDVLPKVEDGPSSDTGSGDEGNGNGIPDNETNENPSSDNESVMLSRNLKIENIETTTGKIGDADNHVTLTCNKIINRPIYIFLEGKDGTIIREGDPKNIITDKEFAGREITFNLDLSNNTNIQTGDYIIYIMVSGPDQKKYAPKKFAVMEDVEITNCKVISPNEEDIRKSKSWSPEKIIEECELKVTGSGLKGIKVIQLINEQKGRVIFEFGEEEDISGHFNVEENGKSAILKIKNEENRKEKHHVALHQGKGHITIKFISFEGVEKEIKIPQNEFPHLIPPDEYDLVRKEQNKIDLHNIKKTEGKEKAINIIDELIDESLGHKKGEYMKGVLDEILKRQKRDIDLYDFLIETFPGNMSDFVKTLESKILKLDNTIKKDYQDVIKFLKDLIKKTKRIVN